MNAYSKEAASSSSGSQLGGLENNNPPVSYEEETRRNIHMGLSMKAANDRNRANRRARANREAHAMREAQMMNVGFGGQVQWQGQPAGPRRCYSCHVINTPLWRRGPLGYGTLCNACGLRYWKEERILSTKLTLSLPNTHR